MRLKLILNDLVYMAYYKLASNKPWDMGQTHASIVIYGTWNGLMILPDDIFKQGWFIAISQHSLIFRYL